MRNDFVRQVIIEMAEDKNIFFITVDLGYNALEEIRDTFRDRFVNIGIMEANAIGVAAGMALSGKKVIVYSISPFITMRCYEQIRLDICYHNLDVKIIGTGGGVNYAMHGVSHHSFEDYAIMTVLANMTVVSPGFSTEAIGATRAIIRHKGPVYMRLGKKSELQIQDHRSLFELGRGYVIEEGRDIVLLSTGNILDMSLSVASIVRKTLDLSVCVISLPTIKPIDRELILSRAKSARAIYTLEEHNVIGGIGSMIAMMLLENQVHIKFKAYGFRDIYATKVGDRNFLLSDAGLHSAIIAQSIVEMN